jgi:tripartite-type tricarboxylate transporter receptor subunit TctC
MTIVKLPRRTFLHLAAGAAVLPAVSRIAGAQTYPTRPVRIVVGFPPGGGADIVARLIGQSLSERLGRPFVIENRAGAGSNIATEAVVNAAPDGYTLLLVSGANTINATLYDKLNFDFLRDIVPIASFTRAAGVMVVNPQFPSRTASEFIAYAKANPGKLNMASGGNAGAPHIYGELFKMMAGVDMVHVPYRGAPFALTALFAGEAHVMFDTVSTSIEHIRAGKLRALAVTAAMRLDVLPDIPTLGEIVPGYEGSVFSGIGAPRGTPPEIIERLNQEINAALADERMKARLAALGYTLFPGSPADFAKFIADETEKWGKVVKFAGMKPG